MAALQTLLEKVKRPLVMGIVNRTPDSFSDGGEFLSETGLKKRLDELVVEGADLVDIGAESSRPGAKPVDSKEQILRIGSSIREANDRGFLVSVDTTDEDVATFALDEGASIINSISLKKASTLGKISSKYNASLILMHSRGELAGMKTFSDYPETGYINIVQEVFDEWQQASSAAMESGMKCENLVFDPGLGFAKNQHHTMKLCKNLEYFQKLGVPILVGPSRKSFLAKIHQDFMKKNHGREEPLPKPENRLGGTMACHMGCIQKGAQILRVHDVGIAVQTLAFWNSFSDFQMGSEWVDV